MPEIPRTKFNSPWTVANIEASLNDVSSAKGSSESLTAALNAMRAEINSLSGGVHLKGAVDYYSDLPASPSEGDAYTVRYQGTSGTEPLGIEYAWATYQGTPQWIPIGVDPSVFARQDEMNVVANAGAKNLLKIDKSQIKSSSWNTDWTWSGDTASNGNASITINQDNTFTVAVSNTMAAQVIFDIYLSNDDVSNVILSGCPSGGSSSTHFMYVKGTTYYDTGNGVTFSRTGSFRIAIVVASGHAAGTYIFKPMLRPAAITDPTFQLYAKTNSELTVLTDEDRASLVEIVDNGAKNSIDLSKATSVTKTDGMTYTLNADGSVAVSWNLSGTIGVIRFNGISLAGVDATSLVLSGCPSGGGNLSYRLDIRQGAEGSETSIAIDFGESSSFTKPVGDIKVCIRVGKQTGSATFYPMICTQVAWKISKQYQPFRPSWQEMWDAIQALQSGGNRALMMQMQPTESTEPEQEER